MSEPPADPPAGVPADSDAAGDDGVAIRVARSGGIAGMTRRWSVQPSGSEREHWMLLVERCPWDEKPPAGTGADRFLWRIEVRVRQERHEQVIPEEHLQGPWRALVDAVREADAGAGGA